MLVLARQKTAIRTLKTVREDSTLVDSVYAQADGSRRGSRYLGKPWLLS